MTNFEWKILELSANEGQITSAKYHCKANDGDVFVETEGNWKFEKGETSIPFEQVTEDLVVQWIEDSSVVDGKCVIKSRLVEQLQTLQKQNVVVAPWLPQIFTPNI
jgi:hypothetical protein